MMSKLCLFLSFFFSCLLANVYCEVETISNRDRARFEVSRKDFNIGFVNKYDRVFHYTTEVFSDISFTFNNFLSLKVGTCAGGNNIYTDWTIPVEAELSFNFLKPKFFKYFFYDFIYSFENIPKFHIATNTIISTIAVKGERFGINIGYRKMWSHFYDESAIEEGNIAFSIYATLVNAKQINLFFLFANYNFYNTASPFGAYFFAIDAKYKINDDVSFYNNINLFQTGSLGFTSVPYGISLTSGVKLSW
ncbi:MAG: hypothetical protein Ta2B_04960 [Termitinemataceae bacterium]|nr:MAG: hypothetical protein Ta2B_04960 [Termitinemataceae bacterium]